MSLEKLKEYIVSTYVELVDKYGKIKVIIAAVLFLGTFPYSIILILLYISGKKLGLDKYLKNFGNSTLEGFKTDENLSGFKGLISRFTNLWRHNLQGKITIIVGLFILIIFSFGGGPSPEEANAQWFEYSKDKAQKKLSELMKKNDLKVSSEDCTNCDQLPLGSITGWNSDGTPATSYLKQRHRKLWFYPGGGGTLYLGSKNNPHHSISWTTQYDNVFWYVQLSPNVNTMGGRWNPPARTYDQLIFKESDLTYIEKLSTITSKLPNEDQKIFFSFVDSLKDAFMSENNYIFSNRGWFEKSRSNWKNGKKHGQWYTYLKVDSDPEEEDPSFVINTDIIYDEGKEIKKIEWEYSNNGKPRLKTITEEGKDGEWYQWYSSGPKWVEGTIKNGRYLVSKAWDQNNELKVDNGNGVLLYKNTKGRITRQTTYQDGVQGQKIENEYFKENLGDYGRWDDEARKKVEKHWMKDSLYIRTIFEFGKETEKVKYHYNNKAKKIKQVITYFQGEEISYKGINYQNYEPYDIKSKSFFTNGRKDGVDSVFSKEGNLTTLKTFKNGKINHRINWREDGTKRYSSDYIDGFEALEKEFYTNGSLKYIRSYVPFEDKLNNRLVQKLSSTTEFYENGQKKAFYRSAEIGKIKQYGSIWKYGRHIEWYENGNKKLEGLRDASWDGSSQWIFVRTWEENGTRKNKEHEDKKWKNNTRKYFKNEEKYTLFHEELKKAGLEPEKVKGNLKYYDEINKVLETFLWSLTNEKYKLFREDLKKAGLDISI